MTHLPTIYIRFKVRRHVSAAAENRPEYSPPQEMCQEG
jgi:hypothetical protein